MPFSQVTLTPRGIREAFVDRLVEVGVAPVVEHALPRKFSRNEATPAALNVFSDGSSGDSKAPGGSPRFDTSFRVYVVGTIYLPEGGAWVDTSKELADRLDDLEIAIKQAICGSRRLTGSFRRIASVRVQKGQDSDGLDFRGTVSVEFTIEYFEQFDYVDVVELPWLEEVRITLVPAGATTGCLVTDAGDILITDDGECFGTGTPPIDIRPIYRVRVVTSEGDNLVTSDSDQFVTDQSQGFEAA